MHPRPGAINIGLTIGSKTLLTTFFVIDGKGSYSLLHGRDWIHANCCVAIDYASMLDLVAWRQC